MAVSLVAFFLGTTEYSLTHSIDFFADIGNTTQIGKDIIINTKQTVQDSMSVLNQFPTIEPAASCKIREQQNYRLDSLRSLAIIFRPFYRNVTAGVGLSGDLKDPGKSIPLEPYQQPFLNGHLFFAFINLPSPVLLRI
ncbi:MAG: hypothetical protein R2769_04100 [Saprospiraceae bacterium]